MNISIRNLQKKIPIPVSKIKSVVRKTCATPGVAQVISIVFVGPRRMRRLNRAYLGHDWVTDVLTFATPGVAQVEIIICPAMAVINARRYQTTIKHELLLYVIHGLLHVAGYDDRTTTDRERMAAKEAELLKNVDLL